MTREGWGEVGWGGEGHAEEGPGQGRCGRGLQGLGSDTCLSLPDEDHAEEAGGVPQVEELRATHLRLPPPGERWCGQVCGEGGRGTLA